MPAGSFVPTTTPTSSYGRYPIRVKTYAPLAYWRLGERSGTVAADSFGTNTGTYVGSPTLNVTGAVTSDSDAAVTLNGTTQEITAPDATALDTANGAITILAWIKRAAVTTYPAAVLADSPIFHLRLGEASSTFADSSGNGHTGSLVGAATRAVAGGITADTDNAITFAGAGRVNIPTDAALNVTTAWSIEAWFKRSVTAVNEYIYNKGFGGLGLRFESTNDRIRAGQFGGPTIVESSIAITDTSWHHVVATSAPAMYIDGVDRTGTTAVVTPVANGDPAAIGADYAGDAGSFFTGSLDEVALYGTALSATRIAAHYTLGIRSGAQAIVTKGTGAWYLRLSSANKLNFWRSAQADLATGTGTISDTSSWHMVTVTYAGANGAVIFYIDGALDRNAGATVCNLVSNAELLAIGADGTTDWFTGSVDEVAVWNRALSASEISALYTDGTYTAVRHITVRIANKDVTPYVVADTFELEDASGDGAQGTFRCTINRALSLLPELFADAWVEVFDHDTGSDIFRGFLKTYRPVLSDGTTLRQTEIVATDHGELMDRFVPGPVRRPVEGDRARIAHFWHYYGASHRLNHHLTYVQSIDTSQEAQTFTGTTLRRVFDAIAAQAGTTVRWYLDQVGRLHYYSTESNPAPRNVTSDTPGTGEISVEDLEIDYEAGAYANRVWVNGANATATGYVQDDAAIHKIGTLMTASDPIDAPHATTAAARNKIGAAYLARVTAGISRGSFSVTSNKATGWLAGQTLTVRSSSIGINSSTRIIKVTTTMLKNDVRHYAIEFGSIRKPRGR